MSRTGPKDGGPPTKLACAQEEVREICLPQPLNKTESQLIPMEYDGISLQHGAPKRLQLE